MSTGVQVWEDAWRRLTGLRSEDGTDPLFPGVVLLAGTPAGPIFSRAAGWARCYADGSGVLLGDEDRVPMRPDTIFDLASVSKLFCSIVIMKLVERGLVDLDRPVVDYLEEFGRPTPAKSAITVRRLLTHTSGFPAELPLWREHRNPESRIRGALTAELIAEPGTAYCYSDLNLITLGELARRSTGSGLDELVAELITRPLGMVDTGYRPAPGIRSRTAATEYQRIPDRGLVWGEVHDENAWSLDGVAGHAGVFSTAADLALLADAVIANDRDGTGPLLPVELFTAMVTNQTPEFDGHDHGLGFELNQPWYMGRSAGPRTIGHTGYTGTSLVIDLDRGGYVILLTNRVHPSRHRGTVNPARALVGDALADTLGEDRTTPGLGAGSAGDDLDRSAVDGGVGGGPAGQ
ncbi:serine hydrolase domain-containing protein [Microlunatus soli]|uniref:CubicO group peptidase, beta-lactamase class C family n=1 Tax=Microlunatus soli TaxID=630515 RepID=A0A1H1Q9E7_9ACTN|nr:serine hydrolase domain-containing protein [Microlunatus soli]SDS19933.1 CubicO group peptidase, beta-lactamase class C family [Microlunatus soli]